MNSTLQRIKTWRSRRQLRSLQKWEQMRAEGKRRFILRTGLSYAVTVIGATNVYEQFFDGGHPSISLVKLFFYSIGGLYLASDAWSRNEGKYRIALSKARVKASPSGALPAHNSPLQITSD